MDWAVLHDILKGIEPDCFFEYFPLVISAVIVLFQASGAVWTKKPRKAATGWPYPGVRARMTAGFTNP